MKPTRVQRRRTKGWRMPPNTVCVTRPSLFGNPFCGPDARRSVRLYRLMLAGRWAQLEREGCDLLDLIALQMRRKWIRDRLHLIRGKHLACYCRADAVCHADVLLVVANKEDGK